jgi:GDPmannose 4,6-dehydratase
MNNKIIITGISGQDGSLLANFLLKKKYKIFGIIRNLKKNKFNNINLLKIKKKITFIKCQLSEYKKMSSLIQKIKPIMFFNFAGVSSLEKSFKKPIYTNTINSTAVINILESIKTHSKKTKFFQASTSHLFKIDKKKINENSEFNPTSPYAIAKLSSFFFTKYYRNKYNLFATNGFFFNHESIFRENIYVTKKIIEWLVKYKIKKKYIHPLYLGNIYIKKDWGDAEDYVKLSYKILKQKKPDDFIICTGKNYTLKHFINVTAQNLSIDIKWLNVKTANEVAVDKKTKTILIKIKKKLFRIDDFNNVIGDNFKAKKIFNWEPVNNINFLIKKMIKHEMNKYKTYEKN